MKSHDWLIAFGFLALVLPSTLADQPSGMVIAWGDANSIRSEGPFPSIDRATNAVSISGGFFTNAIAVSAGIFHSVALRSDGAVVGWGNNTVEQALGFATPGVEATNGVVAIKGRTLRNVSAVAAGASFSLALRADGTVVAWGSSKEGECDVPRGLTNITAISAGDFRSLVLKSDGTVAAWGKQKDVFHGISNIVAISASRSWFWNDAVLLRDGTVLEQLPDREIRVPLSVSNFVAVSSGYNHGLALSRDGAVFGWGANDGGQATGVPTITGSRQSSGIVVIDGNPLTNAVAISAGQEYSLALKNDGTVVAWGNKRFYRDVPADLKGVVAISAGDGFCLAITTNYVSFLRQK